MSTSTLILTAILDAKNQVYFNTLRQRHFPPERNFLDAHVTMFHALPGECAQQIDADLKAASFENDAFKGMASGIRFLGRGVAFILDSPRLVQLRSSLARAWQPMLTAQDSQPWRPHITIQNKVSPEEARLLADELKRGFEPWPLQFEGLALWHYAGGPWNKAATYRFRNVNET